MSNDTSAILKGLRNLFDGSSTFMSGHQIKRIRTSSRARKAPAWAKDEDQIRGLLLRTFPKLAINYRQRRCAGRWMMVIQLYFRDQKSWRETADAMGEKPSTVLSLTRTIVRAVNGRRADGKGLRKRKHAINRTSRGGANKDLLGTIKPDDRLQGDRVRSQNSRMPRDENSYQECEGSHLLLN